MAVKKHRCLYCKEFFEDTIKTRVGRFCSFDHAIAYANKKTQKAEKKEQKKKDTQRKKELMSRAEWYNKLQGLVNQYVRLVRDVNESCCTCGTTNPNIKYDAGHYIPQKGYDPRRFELTNIHKQCSVQCNQHGSGRRAEYEEFIIRKYGKEHLDWLKNETNHKSLKEAFPHWQDIENEIKRYRQLLRDNGIKPCW